MKAQSGEPRPAAGGQPQDFWHPARTPVLVPLWWVVQTGQGGPDLVHLWSLPPSLPSPLSAQGRAQRLAHAQRLSKPGSAEASWATFMEFQTEANSGWVRQTHIYSRVFHSTRFLGKPGYRPEPGADPVPTAGSLCWAWWAGPCVFPPTPVTAPPLETGHGPARMNSTWHLFPRSPLPESAGSVIDGVQAT